MCKTMIVSACAAVLLAAGTAKAGLLAYEGYGTGTTGFSDPFNAPGTGTGGEGVYTTGLQYGSLQTSGMAIMGSSSGSFDADRATLSQTINSGVVWMSWLYSPGSTVTDWARMKTLAGTQEITNLGLIGDTFTLRTLNPYSDTSAGMKATAGSTYMFVTKFDFTGAGPSVTMWINPDPGSLGHGDSPQGGTQLSSSAMTAAQTAFNRIGFDDGPGTTATHDEIRIGTTWADVSPVPEPAAMALVAVAAAGLGIRRRRA